MATRSLLAPFLRGKRFVSVLLGGLTGLISCQPLSLQVMAPPRTLQAETPFARIQIPTLIDLGKGHSSPAQLHLRIQTRTAWCLLANSSGSPAALVSEIDQFRLYLIDAASPPSGALTVSHGPFDVNAALLEGGQTLVFRNLPPSQGDYYVAVQALNSANQNLTRLNTGWSINGESVTLSTQGGEGTGQMAVNANYTVSTATPLEVFLNLRDAEGARLDIPLTVTDSADFQANDIAYFQLYLVDSNQDNPTVLSGPFQINAALSNNQQHFQVFHLLPGAYYVALAAYDAQAQNLTGSLLTVSGEPASLSSGGGETPVAPGKISIATDYAVSSTEALSVALTLKSL